MSNFEQAALGIVGGIVGWFVGGPQGAYYGFQLGLLAGSALFPTQLPHLQGPRLGEGQQTVSTVGQPIPWIFGTQPVGGNIIWASPIREVPVTQDVGGKGGPEQSQTTYTYYRSFAILLCEGPIAGVRRIWANGKLIYDKSLPGDESLDEILEDGSSDDVQDLVTGQVVSQDLEDRMTIYLGTEDQMPDPTIESFKGVGKVLAYRGYAYIVFNDVQLKPEDGNRIPASWKFEVYESANEQAGAIEQCANSRLYRWLNSPDPYNPANEHVIAVARTGYEPTPTLSGPFESRTYALDAVSELRGRPFVQYISYARSAAADGNALIAAAGGPSKQEDVTLYFHYNTHVPIRYVVTETSGVCSILREANVDSGVAWSNVGTTGDAAYGALYEPVLEYLPAPGGIPENWGGKVACTDEADRTYFYSIDCIVSAKRVPQPPPQCTGAIVLNGFCVDEYGMIAPNVPWTYDNTRTFLALSSYVDNGAAGQVLSYPLDPVVPIDDPRADDQEYWEEAYELAVARGYMLPDKVYGVDYPVQQNFAYVRTLELNAVVPNPVSLASIISRICERVGLVAYDVSDLEDEYIIGYQLARPMAARAAIEPLRQVGFFDVVESGIELKFPKRGKSAVATLTHDDLGAHFDGEDRPPAITTSRKLELELPRMIRVHFMNPDADYDPGEELSPARFDTEAESVLDVDLAVAITPTKAAQIADVLYRDTWVSRWVHAVQVDHSYGAIEPADCIIAPVDGRAQRMRVTSINDRLPNVRALELVRDDDGTYVSYAVGTESPNLQDRIQITGPVGFVFLDIPALSASHNDAGFYAAVYPLLRNGLFNGARIYRSASNGAVYENVASGANAAAVGELLETPSEGPSTIFDELNEVIVELYYGTLESQSEEDVNDGANLAAIGRDGAWQLIQFKNAENVTGNVWKLTGILWGRRGTEHLIGDATMNDTFVLLSNVIRVPLQIEDVHKPLLYRVTPTNSTATTDPESFTGRGVALKPFSPVHAEATRNDDGDITITWIPRDRIGTDVDASMTEELEDYEVDILWLGEVRRTISSSTTSVTYTAEQQITDFGSLQSEGTLVVTIQQISTAVGRGVALEAVL